MAQTRERLANGSRIRSYDTTVDDLWDAITTPERLARWFMPVEGDLRLGGRYQLKGNAGGTITRCKRPTALDVTWEAMGVTSWVNVRLSSDGSKARLTLEHIAHKDGIGWDLGLFGLERHLLAPSGEDPDEARAKAERTIAAYTGA
jgi:hypothetical protein